MKKFIKNTANSIRTKAIRLAATRRSGEGYIDTAVKSSSPWCWARCCWRASTLCSAMWSCPH